MKSRAIILASLAWAFCACTSRIHMPTVRPADLRVSYYEGGGMLPESESCTVTADSAVYESMYTMVQNHWRCTPTAAEMDALWAELVKLDALNIRTEDRGMVYDRGGITLHFSYGQTDAQVIDGGNLFVVEADAQRFGGASQAIYQTTQGCLERQKFPIQLALLVETDSIAVESYQISLDRREVFAKRDPNTAESSHAFTQKMLPGHYMLAGNALVGDKSIYLLQQVEISPEKHSYQIVLKSDTFELHQ